MTPEPPHAQPARAEPAPLPVAAPAPFEPLQTLAPAKINLGLFVGPVRSDGRHELVSAMQSISLCDELTLERAGGKGSADEVLCPDAPELAGPHNLAARALVAFRERTGWDPGGLRLTIRKRVPVTAGMGGGSGDAAAALRLAAHASGVWSLESPSGPRSSVPGPGVAQSWGSGASGLLLELARELGADVPAQLLPGRWLAQGAGERLTPLPAPTEPFGVLVLPLPHALSTAAVYAQADRLGIGRSRDELSACAERLEGALAHGKQLPPPELLHNDLERPAISLCPPIEGALEQARAAGADVTLVSGSGPTVLGLFAGADGAARAREAAERLGDRSPQALWAAPLDAGAARVVAVRNNDP